jgi:hypothetical protein
MACLISSTMFCVSARMKKPFLFVCRCVGAIHKASDRKVETGFRIIPMPVETAGNPCP